MLNPTIIDAQQKRQDRKAMEGAQQNASGNNVRQEALGVLSLTSEREATGWYEEKKRLARGVCLGVHERETR
jgi:hypothetical protein